LKYLFNCFYSAHIGSYQTAYKVTYHTNIVRYDGNWLTVIYNIA